LTSAAAVAAAAVVACVVSNHLAAVAVDHTAVETYYCSAVMNY
jgi:hypothetical protein